MRNKRRNRERKNPTEIELPKINETETSIVVL
jgi:hypothetical protein